MSQSLLIVYFVSQKVQNSNIFDLLSYRKVVLRFEKLECLNFCLIKGLDLKKKKPNPSPDYSLFDDLQIII